MKIIRFEYSLMAFDLERKCYPKNIIWILNRVSQSGPSKKILETGCGNVIGTMQILKYFQPDQLVASEWNASLVEIDRKKYKGLKTIIKPTMATYLQFAENRILCGHRINFLSSHPLSAGLSSGVD